MNDTEREKAKAKLERDRARLVKRLRAAAEAEDVFEHVNLSRFGSQVFWGRNRQEGELERGLGVVIDPLGEKWHWTTNHMKTYDPTLHDTQEAALRAGLLGFARQEELRNF